MQSVREYRHDLWKRYSMIKHELGEFKGKTVIDIGCANGWFPINLIIEGMKSGIGIELNKELIDEANNYASENNIDFLSSPNYRDFDERSFDYCLYLDLHFHDTNYLPWIKEHCRVLFVSPAQDGYRTNPKLENELKTYFGNYELIGNTHYSDRNLYKVMNELS